MKRGKKINTNIDNANKGFNFDKDIIGKDIDNRTLPDEDLEEIVENVEPEKVIKRKKIISKPVPKKSEYKIYTSNVDINNIISEFINNPNGYDNVLKSKGYASLGLKDNGDSFSFTWNGRFYSFNKDDL